MLGRRDIHHDGTFVVETYQTNVFLARAYTIILRPDRDRSNGKTRELADRGTEGRQGEPGRTRPKSVIPERFLDVKTSGLWVNLEKDTNWVEINL